MKRLIGFIVNRFVLGLCRICFTGFLLICKHTGWHLSYFFLSASSVIMLGVLSHFCFNISLPLSCFILFFKKNAPPILFSCGWFLLSLCLYNLFLLLFSPSLCFSFCFLVSLPHMALLTRFPLLTPTSTGPRLLFPCLPFFVSSNSFPQ